MFEQNELSTFIKRLIIISAVVGILGFFLSLGVVKLSMANMLLRVMPQHQLLSQMNVLVLGIDETGDSQRSDTIMVVNINPQTQHIGLISIPRDTRVYIPGYGMDKINHSYMYGGIKLVQQTAASFLKVPVPYYVAINMAGLSKIVDTAGGVEIDVEKRMYYVDKAGDLYIDLKPGRQLMSGEKAMGYVRFRHDNDADIGRTKRQQKFIQALGQKILSAGLLVKAPFILKNLSDNMKTNLSPMYLVTFASKMKDGYQQGKIDMVTIPGNSKIVDGLSYWIPDLKQTEVLVNKVINDLEYISEKEAQKAIKPAVVPAPEPVHQRISGGKAPSRLKIEVLNGTERAGSALWAAQYLQSYDYMVPWIGDAKEKKYSRSELINWKGKKYGTEAQALADVAGIDRSHIITYDYPQKEVDFTVIVGKDWKN